MAIQGEKLIIVGIYAPNDNKANFYKELEDQLYGPKNNINYLMGWFP